MILVKVHLTLCTPCNHARQLQKTPHLLIYNITSTLATYVPTHRQQSRHHSATYRDECNALRFTPPFRLFSLLKFTLDTSQKSKHDGQPGKRKRKVDDGESGPWYLHTSSWYAKS